MKKIVVFSMFLIFSLLLVLGGCQEGTVAPPTPAPTSAPTTGSISGIVTEKGTGIPLSGVTITVDGSTTVTTGSSGAYSITNLSPGFHSLKFEKVGYKTETPNVNVIAGQDTPKGIELENTQATKRLYLDDDTYIYQGGSVNGLTNTIALGAIVAGFDARMLIKFDYDFTIPSNAKVISAKLKLYKRITDPISGSPVPYIVYPLIEAWDESSATWTMRTSGFPWFVAGGSYDESFNISEGSFTLGGLLSWSEVDITRAFTYWAQGNENDGVIIVSKQATSAYVAFVSSNDNANFDYQPYVDVEYYIP